MHSRCKRVFLIIRINHIIVSFPWTGLFLISGILRIMFRILGLICICCRYMRMSEQSMRFNGETAASFSLNQIDKQEQNHKHHGISIHIGITGYGRNGAKKKGTGCDTQIQRVQKHTVSHTPLRWRYNLNHPGLQRRLHGTIADPVDKGSNEQDGHGGCIREQNEANSNKYSPWNEKCFWTIVS